MQKTLIKSNKYLRNPKKRRRILVSHAIASSKIEGMNITKKRASAIVKRVFKKAASS